MITVQCPRCGTFLTEVETTELPIHVEVLRRYCDPAGAVARVLDLLDEEDESDDVTSSEEVAGYNVAMRRVRAVLNEEEI